MRTSPFAARLVILGDRALLARRAARIGLTPRYADFDPVAYAPTGGVVEIWHQPIAAPVTPGYPDPTNAISVLTMLQNATDVCATGDFAAMVTAPIQKSVMMDAGIPFSGHTEYLAERTHTPRVVMLLVGGTTRGTIARSARDHASAVEGRARRAHAQRIARDAGDRRQPNCARSSGSKRRASPCAG